MRRMKVKASPLVNDLLDHLGNVSKRALPKTAKTVERIKNGTEELDMKETHAKGQYSRVSKKGWPYLIVPFQWGTKEGSKRAGVKNIVPSALLMAMRNKRFKQSAVKNKTYPLFNQAGQMAERNAHTWGDRARGSDFANGIMEDFAL